MKIALLAVILLGTGARFLRGQAWLDTRIAGLYYFYCLVGLLFAIYGLLRGTLGAWDSARLFAAWPAVYAALTMGASTYSRTPRHLTNVLLIGAVAVEVYAVTFVLASRGIIPMWLHVQLDLGQRIGFYEGQSGFALHSISSLVYLIPFVTSLLILRPPGQDGRWFRFGLYVLAAVGAALAVLSARRGLMLIIAVAPFIALFTRQVLSPKGSRVDRLPWFSWGLVVGVGALVGPWLLRRYFGIQLSVVFGTFDLTQSSRDAGLAVRRTQFEGLIEGWSSSPFFGLGLGAHLPDFIVSVEQPWAYELSYVALLFQVGLVGFLLYSAGVVWTVYNSVVVARRSPELAGTLLPMVVAMVCFLIANATNPYLAKFDFLWVLFLPVMVINHHRVRASMPTLDIDRLQDLTPVK